MSPADRRAGIPSEGFAMLMTGLNTTTLALGMPGPVELMVLLILGLLIFGRRLPEVGRSLGKSIVEFKRGVRDIQSEIEEESAKPATEPAAPAQIDAPERVQTQGSKIVDAEPVAEEIKREGGSAAPESA